MKSEVEERVSREGGSQESRLYGIPVENCEPGLGNPGLGKKEKGDRPLEIELEDGLEEAGTPLNLSDTCRKFRMKSLTWCCLASGRQELV